MNTLDNLLDCNKNFLNKDFRSKHAEVENIPQNVLKSVIPDTIIVFNKLDLVNNSEILKIHNWIAGGDLSKNDKKQESESSQKPGFVEKYDSCINYTACHKKNDSDKMEKSDESDYKTDSVSMSEHANCGKGMAKILGSVSFDKGTNTISSPDTTKELFSFNDKIGSSLRNIQNNAKDFSEEEKSDTTPVVCCISCVTGAGMDRFLEVLKGKVSVL
jgi:hypothetical protein